MTATSLIERLEAPTLDGEAGGLTHILSEISVYLQTNYRTIHPAEYTVYFASKRQ